jgi:hypothetical protein
MMTEYYWTLQPEQTVRMLEAPHWGLSLFAAFSGPGGSSTGLMASKRFVDALRLSVQSGVHDRTPMDEERNSDCNGGHEHQYERRRLAY